MSAVHCVFLVAVTMLIVSGTADGDSMMHGNLRSTVSGNPDRLLSAPRVLDSTGAPLISGNMYTIQVGNNHPLAVWGHYSGGLQNGRDVRMYHGTYGTCNMMDCDFKVYWINPLKKWTIMVGPFEGQEEWSWGYSWAVWGRHVTPDKNALPLKVYTGQRFENGDGANPCAPGDCSYTIEAVPSDSRKNMIKANGEHPLAAWHLFSKGDSAPRDINMYSGSYPSCDSGDCDFKFVPMPNKNDQCSNPVLTATMDNTLKGQLDKHFGKCVRAEWHDWNGHKYAVNVKVGSTLPNPGTCSEVAKQFNSDGAWNFEGTGYCGSGGSDSADVKATKDLHKMKLSCFIHDVCVWYNCQKDALVPNYIEAMKKGGLGGANGKEADVVIMKLLTDIVPKIREDGLRKGDPICGKQLYETEAAFDAENKIRVEAIKALAAAANAADPSQHCEVRIFGFCVFKR